MAENSKIAELLYECIRELQYVQEAKDTCSSDLCASALGAELIKRGMELLGVKDLSGETLSEAPARSLAHKETGL